MPKQVRLLLLFSDTGGGHRSAAEAILEAVAARYADRCEFMLVDVLKSYSPLPIRLAPQMYPGIVRLPGVWGLGYRLLDSRRRAQAISLASWPYVRRHIRRMVSEQPADVVVSVHPLAISPVIRGLGPKTPPFLTVVTDLVSTHAFWYDRRVDLCIVPTEKARDRALECGLSREQVRVVGFPVGRKFCRPTGDPEQLRAELGWPLDMPVVLLVGGGEGMGPIYETARAINHRAEGYCLVVVTGRNQRLRKRLEAAQWRVPTFVYGFETRMAEMMEAATLLVTKAGSGTISEALLSGLPMVLYSRLSGQEEGNVDYLVEEGVGVWAPGPERAAAAVQDWLRHPDELKAATEWCRRISRPTAALEIAEIIGSYLPLGPSRPNATLESSFVG